MGGKDKPWIFIHTLAEGSMLERGHADFADVTDSPTDQWPYDMSF